MGRLPFCNLPQVSGCGEATGTFIDGAVLLGHYKESATQTI